MKRSKNLFILLLLVLGALIGCQENPIANLLTPSENKVMSIPKVGDIFKDGQICFVDTNARKFVYLVKKGEQNWFQAKKIADSTNGYLGSVGFLQSLYPQKKKFDLTGAFYWSDEEAKDQPHYAKGVAYNAVGQEQFNGCEVFFKKNGPGFIIVFYKVSF